LRGCITGLDLSASLDLVSRPILATLAQFPTPLRHHYNNMNSLEEIYNTIKANEACFPLPTPSKTVSVGSFNAQTGDFEYSVPTYLQPQRIVPPDPTGRGPQKPVIIPSLTGGSISVINVFKLILRFNVSGRQGDFTLRGEGSEPIQAPQGQNYIDWDTGTAQSVMFSLSCSGNMFSSSLPLLINRPIVGAGAITIPALPITVVYAPPVDKQKKNISKWAVTDTTGNTTTVSFSTQNSTTKPAASQFQGLMYMASGMKDLSAVLSAISQPAVKAIGQALGVLSGLLGAASATETKGTTVTNQQTLIIADSNQSTLTTDPNGGGPGRGDIIAFYQNARVCWFTNGGPMQLALLGYDAYSTCFVSDLQGQGAENLDSNTIQALLKLDPFVAGGAEADLSNSPRFAYIDTFNVGSDQSHVASHSLTTLDIQQTVNTTVDVEIDNAGFLGFLGIGVPDTQTIQTTLSQSSSVQTTTTETIQSEVDLYFAPGETKYVVDLYCDVVFGTFAYRLVPDAEIQSRGPALRPMNTMRPLPKGVAGGAQVIKQNLPPIKLS
jgi:hypothetical protein